MPCMQSIECRPVMPDKKVGIKKSASRLHGGPCIMCNDELITITDEKHNRIKFSMRRTLQILFKRLKKSL